MTTQTLTTRTPTSDRGGLMRTLVATYALTACAVGMAGLFWVILAAGGLAPHGLTELQVGTPALAVLINVLLVTASATQHTIMARNWFKQAVARLIPQADRALDLCAGSGAGDGRAGVFLADRARRDLERAGAVIQSGRKFGANPD